MSTNLHLEVMSDKRLARQVWVGGIAANATEEGIRHWFNTTIEECGFLSDGRRSPDLEEAGIEAPQPVVSVQFARGQDCAYVEVRTCDTSCAVGPIPADSSHPRTMPVPQQRRARRRARPRRLRLPRKHFVRSPSRRGVLDPRGRHPTETASSGGPIARRNYRRYPSDRRRAQDFRRRSPEGPHRRRDRGRSRQLRRAAHLQACSGPGHGPISGA